MNQQNKNPHIKEKNGRKKEKIPTSSPAAAACGSSSPPCLAAVPWRGNHWQTEHIGVTRASQPLGGTHRSGEQHQMPHQRNTRMEAGQYRWGWCKWRESRRMWWKEDEIQIFTGGWISWGNWSRHLFCSEASLQKSLRVGCVNLIMCYRMKRSSHVKTSANFHTPPRFLQLFNSFSKHHLVATDKEWCLKSILCFKCNLEIKKKLCLFVCCWAEMGPWVERSFHKEEFKSLEPTWNKVRRNHLMLCCQKN